MVVEAAVDFTGQALDVMSFNIRYQNDNDAGERSWDTRKDAVVKIIETIHPDIIGVQEALHGQLEHVAGRLKDNQYEWTGVGRDDGKAAGEFAPVFYRADRFVRDRAGTFWLSDTPDIPGSNTWHNACTRICTWCILRDRDDQDDPVLIMNVHADHRNARGRVKGARLVVDKMLELAPGARVVITGDFNTIGKERSIRIIEGDHGRIRLCNARDAWIRGQGRGTRVPRITWHAFNGPTGKGVIAKITRGLLDHVFFSTAFRIEGYQVMTARIDGIYPSDHFPILVRLCKAG